MSLSSTTENRFSRYASHAKIRTDCYVLLAALLTNAPSAERIDLVRNLCWVDDLPAGIDEALAALNQAGTLCPLKSITAEFQHLFIGLGSGELIPYASWYREKMIQSAPLAAIRADLSRLGIVRQSTCFEPEDHVGALCEIMALLSVPGNDISDEEQALFFWRHVDTWMPSFFQDLQRAQKSRFYRSVGLLGSRFLADESGYLQNFSAEEERI